METSEVVRYYLSPKQVITFEVDTYLHIVSPPTRIILHKTFPLLFPTPVESCLPVAHDMEYRTDQIKNCFVVSFL